MCIRDRPAPVTDEGFVSNFHIFVGFHDQAGVGEFVEQVDGCLLYTSDAADERSSVDLGGRRIITKKTDQQFWSQHATQ